MKTRIFSVLILLVTLMSCGRDGHAEIENDLVVEQVNVLDKGTEDDNGDTIRFQYKIRLESESGTVYYFTDYKHEVGDTLVSIFEFTDNRDRIIRTEQTANDSLNEVIKELKKDNDQLSLYNELLLGIINEDIKNPRDE